MRPTMMFALALCMLACLLFVLAALGAVTLVWWKMTLWGLACLAAAGVLEKFP